MSTLTLASHRLSRGPNLVEMHKPAHVIAAGIDEQGPVVWAEERPDEPATRTVEVHAICTGDAVPDGYHVGSVGLGLTAYHVYVVGQIEPF